MRLSGPHFSEFNQEQQGEDACSEGHGWPAAGASSRPANVNEDAPFGIGLDPTGEPLPQWQRAFMLGPTVRFTRTPDRGAAKRQLEQAQPAESQDPNHMSVAEPATSSIRDNGFPANPALAPHLLTAALQDIAVPEVPPYRPVVNPPLPTQSTRSGQGARALMSELGRAMQQPGQPAPDSAELATARAASPQPQSTAASASFTPMAKATPEPSGKGEKQPDPRMDTVSHAPQATTAARIAAAHLPDHLLWEMLSLGAGENAVAARRMPLPAEPVVRPQPHEPTVLVDGPSIPAPAKQPLTVTVARQNVPAAQSQAPRQQDAFDPLRLYRQVSLRQPTRQTDEPTTLAPAEENEPATDIAGTQPSTADSLPAEPAVAVAPQVRVRNLGESLQAPRPFSAARPFKVDMPELDGYEFPSIELLQAPEQSRAAPITQESLEQSAGLLESVLEDFGIRGEIIDVRPGPVVTLYEFEPAPGVKSSRVIGLSDDIARSMSALSARVAVVPGRNVIGIELPNPIRETVYLRELVESGTYAGTGFRLPLCLGKTIGGEPVVAELAKMPHLLVAGTTGSGKSVAVNTMILSLIYRLRPDQCRLIMVDPKMLELSVYDGIPHLLTPVVTDPKKAVLALKWAVREMEDRYRKMSRLGVRNIDGFNARVAAAVAAGETVSISVETGFDRHTGQPIIEQQDMDLTALPYIVVIVDEMADLMMVAGKEIEGAIQRLAQMARAAGIHLIMATQRPSVDVITGTIKANFPTRISFQVTSKIDSRTILGEQGAEHLLGQGDMLHMVGGGRIARVHGPFVSDQEVERIVAHLKTQGQPSYLGSVTEDEDEEEQEEEDQAVFDKSAMGEEDRDDLYEQAIKVVLRDKKCSTSYIQRRLSVGYNRAASLVERMEKDGLVGAANHVGKREILSQRGQDKPPEDDGE